MEDYKQGRDLPPQSVELEQSLLGVILRDHHVMDEINEIITPDCFYVLKHKIIYRAIVELYGKNEDIEYNLVAEKLGKKLDEVGGRSYLMDVMGATGTIHNAVKYAKQLKEYQQRRELIRTFTDLSQSAYEGEESQAIIEKADATLLKISGADKSDIIPINQLATEYLADLLDNKKPPDDYLTTRIEDLNKKVVGLFRRDLTIIAGPPSMGKSSMAIDIAVINSLRDRKTIYFALDETSEAMAQRVIAAGTGINRNRFYARNFEERERDMMTQYAISLARLRNLHICDKPRLSVMAIRGYANKFKRKNGLDCIIVDYLQQLRTPGREERRDLTVADQCEDLKAIGKDLNIVVIALSQLNREWAFNQIDPGKGKYGFPKLASLRDSGGIEQAANLVLFPWNVAEALRKTGISEDDITYQDEINRTDPGYERAFILVAKNKMGSPGPIECRWWPSRMQFINIDERYEYFELTKDDEKEVVPF